MRKHDELTNPASCMSRATNDELTFVLLGRDKAAPLAIRIWAGERIRLGKNRPDDPQIEEAYHIARQMERERRTTPEERRHQVRESMRRKRTAQKREGRCVDCNKPLCRCARCAAINTGRKKKGKV